MSGSIELRNLAQFKSLYFTNQRIDFTQGITSQTVKIKGIKSRIEIQLEQKCHVINRNKSEVKIPFIVGINREIVTSERQLQILPLQESKKFEYIQVRGLITDIEANLPQLQTLYLNHPDSMFFCLNIRLNCQNLTHTYLYLSERRVKINLTSPLKFLKLECLVLQFMSEGSIQRLDIEAREINTVNKDSAFYSIRSLTISGKTNFYLVNQFHNLEQLFMKDPILHRYEVITKNCIKLKQITIYGTLTQRYFEIKCFSQVKMLDLRDLVMERDSEINVRRVKTPKELKQFNN